MFPMPQLIVSGDREVWFGQDVAEYTGMSLSWVRRKTRMGVVPCQYRGGRPNYDPEKIRTWWAEYDERAPVKKGRS